jgi:hypothetical protein
MVIREIQGMLNNYHIPFSCHPLTTLITFLFDLSQFSPLLILYKSFHDFVFFSKLFECEFSFRIAE